MGGEAAAEPPEAEEAAGNEIWTPTDAFQSVVLSYPTLVSDFRQQIEGELRQTIGSLYHRTPPLMSPNVQRWTILSLCVHNKQAKEKQSKINDSVVCHTIELTLSSLYSHGMLTWSRLRTRDLFTENGRRPVRCHCWSCPFPSCTVWTCTSRRSVNSRSLPNEI